MSMITQLASSDGCCSVTPKVLQTATERAGCLPPGVQPIVQAMQSYFLVKRVMEAKTSGKGRRHHPADQCLEILLAD
eukprot:2024920-Pyramimonas_sp.AAC.1